MVNGQGHRANAYHVRFSELLTGREDALRSGNYESVSRMWQVLATWQRSRDGGRGLCTIPSASDLPTNQSMIGFALSQALLHSNDRQLLPEVFAALRTHNGGLWPLSGASVIGALEVRGWERRFSVGFRRALGTAEFRPLVERLVGSLAASWDGSPVYVPRGTPRAELLLKLDAGRLGWVARMSVRETNRVRLPDGVVLERLGATDYLSVAGLPSPTAQALEQGLRRASQEAVLSRAPTSLLVLSRNDSLGVWVSTDRFIPGEEHVVLASPAAEPDVQRLLDRAASAGPRKERNPGWVPDRWSLHQRVVFDSAVTLRKALGEVSGVIGSLEPVAPYKLHRVGGLRLAPKLDRDLYLTGGEPSVLLPEPEGGVLVVDGAERPDIQGPAALGLPVPLVGLGLEAGAHAVTAGGDEVTFRTADDLPVPALAERLCGFSLTGSKALAYPAELTPGHAALSGADCADRRAAAVPHVVLCRRGVDRLRFAASDGRLWEIVCPEPPAWWVERLPQLSSPYLFEVEVNSVGGWLLEFRAGRWTVRPVNPGTPEPGSSQNASAWAEAVLDAQDAASDPMWCAYVVAAKELVR
jgi:hypothetical protein